MLSEGKTINETARRTILLQWLRPAGLIFRHYNEDLRTTANTSVKHAILHLSDSPSMFVGIQPWLSVLKKKVSKQKAG